MKWSKYTISFEIDNKAALYNTFTNEFCTLSKTEFESINAILDSNSLETQINEQCEYLIKNRFIVDSDAGVVNKLKYKSLEHRFSKEFLDLTIAPTMNCNFSCIYCFEKHKSQDYLSEETQNNIIRFIKSYNTNKVSILWFGGEPLMNFKAIREITKELLGSKIDLMSSIVTNGYLLTPEKLHEFVDLKIDDVQVTIDGIGEIHNSRRPLKKGGPTYDKIIENLDYAIKFAKNNPIRVSIKVTIDSTNHQEFKKVYKYFTEKYKTEFESKVLQVTPNFVNNSADGGVLSSCVLKNNELISYYNQLFTDGFDRKFIKKLIQPELHISPCMMRSINSFGIGPDGNLYKCLEDFGNPNKAIGNINKRAFDEEMFIQMVLSNDVFDKGNCTQCAFLPICSGGCPYSRIHEIGAEDDQYHCTIFKKHLKEIMNLYYKCHQALVSTETIN